MGTPASVKELPIIFRDHDIRKRNPVLIQSQLGEVAHH